MSIIQYFRKMLNCREIHSKRRVAFNLKANYYLMKGVLTHAVKKWYEQNSKKKYI